MSLVTKSDVVVIIHYKWYEISSLLVYAYLVGFSLSRFLGTGTDGGEVRDYFLRVLSLSRSRLSSVDNIRIVKHMCNNVTDTTI